MYATSQLRSLHPARNQPSRVPHQPRQRLSRPLKPCSCDFRRTHAVSQQSDWAQHPDRGANPDADSDIWSALDVVGWVGSVAGTAAFILTQELWLVALPVLMPLLALYASRKKQAHLSEVLATAVLCHTHTLTPGRRQAPYCHSTATANQLVSAAYRGTCAVAWAAFLCRSPRDQAGCTGGQRAQRRLAK